jgi:hypothetical protein
VRFGILFCGEKMNNPIEILSSYKWIKVKRYEDDTTLSWEERYKRLLDHHEKETKFLIQKVREMQINSLYEDSKTKKQYKLLGLAKHSETLETMVIYQAQYGEKEIWVRPLTMWTELVTINEQGVADE